MSIEEQAPPRDRGRLIHGWAQGCITQLFFFIVGFLLASAFRTLNNNGLVTLLWTGWGVAQWLVLVPLILKNKREGRTGTVQGLILSGSLGLLLSSACAGLFLNSR